MASLHQLELIYYITSYNICALSCHPQGQSKVQNEVYFQYVSLFSTQS